MDKAKKRKKIVCVSLLKYTIILTRDETLISPFLHPVFSPRFGEVSEVHLSDEAPADASIVAVLQQHSFLPAVCLVTLRPVPAHPQVELHKLRPFSVQVPAHQLPQPSLTTAHTH